ncbi:hypothetical protein ACFL6D_04825 [Spirochaetota bacterium]
MVILSSRLYMLFENARLSQKIYSDDEFHNEDYYLVVGAYNPGDPTSLLDQLIIKTGPNASPNYTSMAVDDNGNLYLVNNDRNIIEVFSQNKK